MDMEVDWDFRLQHWLHLSSSWQFLPLFWGFFFSSVYVLVIQLCLTLCNPIDSSVHCNLCNSQAPLSMESSRQEYWSGFPFPSPGDLPGSGIKQWSPAMQPDSLLSEPSGKPSFFLLVFFWGGKEGWQVAHPFCWNEFWSSRCNLSKNLALTQAWHVSCEMGFWNREMTLTLSPNNEEVFWQEQWGSVLARDKEEKCVLPLAHVVL